MIHLDVATAQTLDFVSAHASPIPCRILEIGCGDGTLAHYLGQLGNEVVALDSSNQAVETARGRGVDARVCRWPNFADRPYGLLIFSRSLHHMQDLTSAVVRARQLLTPGGLVLVEDFAFADTRPEDVTWFCKLLKGLGDGGVRFTARASPVNNVLRHGGNVAAWHADHDETLHSARAMEAQLKQHVGPTVVTAVPYLYRYVAAAIAASANSATVVQWVLAEERKAAELGQLALIGRRFVAGPR